MKKISFVFILILALMLFAAACNRTPKEVVSDVNSQVNSIVSNVNSQINSVVSDVEEDVSDIVSEVVSDVIPSDTNSK